VDLRKRRTARSVVHIMLGIRLKRDRAVLLLFPAVSLDDRRVCDEDAIRK
jgi:hypothetical protein